MERKPKGARPSRRARPSRWGQGPRRRGLLAAAGLVTAVVTAGTMAAAGNAGAEPLAADRVGAPSSPPPGIPGQAQPVEAYARVATWESRPGDIPPDALLEPTGLTADIFDGRVFVADTGNDRVQVFEADGAFVQSIGAAGDPETLLSRPMDVAVQGSLVFVADNGHDRVALYTVDGQYRGEWRGLVGPWGLAAGADGRVYVAENRAGRIAVYRANGQHLDTWDYGSTALRGLDVAADGRLAIADAGARQVRVVDSAGDELRSSQVLTGPPSDVAFGLGGDIYTTMEGTSLIRMEDALDLPQSGVWPLVGATGVAAGPAGLVYASFQDNDRPQHGVQRWSGSPLATDLLWGQVPAPLGVLLAPRRLDASTLTLVADGWRRVQRFTAAGEAVDQIPTGDLNDVSQGPGGDVLVATDDTVARLRIDGSRAWEWQVPAAAGEYAWIVALTYDGNTDGISVLDVGRQRLWLLDGDGNLLANPSFRPGPGITAALWDIALAAEGYFVVNRRADAVEVRGPNGRTVVRWWEVPGGPLRVTSDGDGHAFVLDRHGWVWKYTATGTLLAVWRAGEETDDASRPYDVTVDGAGRVMVADLGLDRVEVYAEDPGGTPGPVPSFAPNCTAMGRKWAAPTRLVLGDETAVTLAVDGSCPALTTDADIVLVMDVSGSMAGPDAGGTGTKLDASKAAAEGFLDLLPFGTFRVSVVAFNQEAQVLSPLSDLLVQARGALRGMVAAGGTNIAAGVDAARLELSGPRRRLAARGVIVLLTDGFSDPVAAQRSADQAKLEGLRLFTVGFGATTAEDLLRAMASAPDDFYLAPSSVELGNIYAAIADRITADYLFRTLTVIDEMPDNMAFVAGSGSPPPTVSGRTLTWQLADVPLSGILLSYRLRPLETGTWPTNVVAVGEGTDGLGQPSRVDFPVPEVVVTAPTLTPGPSSTPTATATPGPTRVPRPAYLPALRNETCVTRRQHVDVALVIDTSGSMLAPAAGGGTKLDAAVNAAREFVALLDLETDTDGHDAAAIVAFNAAADIVAPLDNDRAALDLALGALPQAPGTRIDLGLEAAGVALAAKARTPGNVPVAVLLTDGRPTGIDADTVRTEAAAVRSAGVIIYGIGLGPDVDPNLLADIAADGRRVVLAPGAQDLAAIYRQIARELPCVVP